MAGMVDCSNLRMAKSLRIFIAGAGMAIAVPADPDAIAQARMEHPAALDGASYAVIAPTYSGAGGTTSFIRLFNGGATPSTFVITVIGSPSGAVYGTGKYVVAPFASPQYPLQAILNQASAGDLVNGDTSYSLYIQDNDGASGFQHVAYNGLNGFFENVSACKTNLNTALGGTSTAAFLPNIHTSVLANYPDEITIHNASNAPSTYSITAFNQNSGAVLRETTAASQMTFVVGPNATRTLPEADFERQVGWSPLPNQPHINLQIAEASGKPLNAVLGVVIHNSVLAADISMTAFCAVGAPVAAAAAANDIGPGKLDGLLNKPAVGPNSYVSLKSVSAILNGAFPSVAISAAVASFDSSVVSAADTAKITAIDDQQNTVTVTSYRGGQAVMQNTYYVVAYTTAAGGGLLLNTASGFSTALSLSILNGEGVSLLGFAYNGGNLTQGASFTATP